MQKDETRPDRLTAIGRARPSGRHRNFVRPRASHACTCGLGNARNHLYKWTNWTVKACRPQPYTRTRIETDRTDRLTHAAIAQGLGWELS